MFGTFNSSDVGHALGLIDHSASLLAYTNLTSWQGPAATSAKNRRAQLVGELHNLRVEVYQLRALVEDIEVLAAQLRAGAVL